MGSHLLSTQKRPSSAALLGREVFSYTPRALHNPSLHPALSTPVLAKTTPVRGCQEGPLKQLLCLEAGGKEALLRHPLRVRKGRGRAGGRQGSLRTPGWPPRTAALPLHSRQGVSPVQIGGWGISCLPPPLASSNFPRLELK